ncbi:hypothetical protein F4779DRAFT_569800 [Xylariaceae sp. FL0662B]|nr:hypothetical protein F4779DRAFT_569800 [Xylariaceae sp. FL0662B]
MSTVDDLTGWAIRRNGSCLLSKEVDCGATVKPYRACCPSSTVCPSQFNVACCPSGTNCTSTIVDTPICANASWAMFDNGGFFCCEEGQVGYNYRGTDGCSKSGTALPDGAKPLAVIDQATRPSTTSSTTSTPTSTETSAPTSESGSSGTAPAGAIAGGVIGGVAFIAIIIICAWLIHRRRRRNGDTTTSNALPPATQSEKDATEATPDRSEVDGTPRAELASEAPNRTYELP